MTLIVLLACALGTHPYRSNLGHEYRYDLKRPADRIRYGIDHAAQVRDRIDPRREIERNLNPGRELRDRKRERTLDY